MAVAWVQGAVHSDSVNTGVASFSVTLSGTTAGNTLLVWAVSFNDTFVPATFGDGTNSYSSVANITTTLTSFMSCAGWIATNIAGGNVTFTVTTAAATADFPDLRIAEVSGVNNSTPIDASTVGKNPNSSSMTATVTCGSSGDLMIAMASVGSHVTVIDAAYTQKVPPTGNDANGGDLAIKSGAASGSQTTNWTQNATSQYLLALVALQAPSAAALEEIGGSPPLPGMPGAPLILAAGEELPTSFPGFVEEWSAGQAAWPAVWVNSAPFVDEEYVRPALEEDAPPLLGWTTPAGVVPFTYDEELGQTVVVAPALEEVACIVWPQPIPAAAWLSVDEELGIPTAIAFEEYAPPPAILFVPIVNASSAAFTDEPFAVFLPPAASPTRFQPSRLSVRRLMKFR